MPTAPAAHDVPRAPEAPLDGVTLRKLHVQSHLPMEGRGLEIAPYFNPIVDKPGHDVFYVDCIDNRAIRRKASQNPKGRERVPPPIDAVWVPGRRLSRCVRGRKFDYAVASHVMEHVPDPLGWLHQVLECLVVGGRIALLLPIRDRTMDFYRNDTTFGQIVGWSIEKPARPTPTQVMDFLSQSFFHQGEPVEAERMPPFERAVRHYGDDDAIRYARFVWKKRHYLDVHCSTWTPESFVEIFTRLRQVGLLECAFSGPYTGFPGATPFEFLAILEKVE